MISLSRLLRLLPRFQCRVDYAFMPIIVMNFKETLASGYANYDRKTW
jgi:hypothetical protein